MDKHSRPPQCSPYTNAKLMKRLSNSLSKLYDDCSIVVICVGSDKVLADCLGPICGSFLAASTHLPVYGTLDEPVHKENLTFHMDVIAGRHPGAKLLIVDAASAVRYKIGDIVLFFEGINAGSAVSKQPIPVGDVSILGVTVQNAAISETPSALRLATVMAMARIIADCILYAFPAPALTNPV